MTSADQIHKQPHRSRHARRQLPEERIPRVNVCPFARVRQQQPAFLLAFLRIMRFKQRRVWYSPSAFSRSAGSRFFFRASLNSISHSARRAVATRRAAAISSFCAALSGFSSAPAGSEARSRSIARSNEDLGVSAIRECYTAARGRGEASFLRPRPSHLTPSPGRSLPVPLPVLAHVVAVSRLQLPEHDRREDGHRAEDEECAVDT